MNEFEKHLFSEMSSTDRCLLFLDKATDLIDFASCMTRQDIGQIQKLMTAMKEMEQNS